MAQDKKREELTWQQKLDRGETLSTLEETKADADFNFKQRLHEAEQREAFEKLKNRGRSSVEPVEETNGGKK